MTLPLDHPTEDRPRRVYFALTNHCNRACPWCSTCSSPAGGAWLTVQDFEARLPKEGPFQVQLEGGEPTIHPRFFDLAKIARANPRCTQLVICTNGVVLPRRKEKLRRWIEALGTPLTLKISVNHYLIDHDPGLIGLCQMSRDLFQELGGERLFVVNARLRRGIEDDDARVKRAIEESGLLAHSNVFFLQRYGFASEEMSWEPPFLVRTHFTLVNPDGRTYGPDLIARSEAMRRLP